MQTFVRFWDADLCEGYSGIRHIVARLLVELPILLGLGLGLGLGLSSYPHTH